MSVAVPDITGGTVDQAQIKLDNAGLLPDWRNEHGEPVSNPSPGAQVTAQNPPEGTEVAQGSSVKATVE